jgi:hypothetical protein
MGNAFSSSPPPLGVAHYKRILVVYAFYFNNRCCSRHSGVAEIMKKISKKLRDRFVALRDLNLILASDTRGCLVKFDDELAYEGTSDLDIDRLNFWLKATVRVFFAHVDGVTSAMRQFVLRAAREGHLKLEPKKVAELSERKYDKASGTLGKSYHGHLEDNFKNAFRYFPRAFGSSWEPKLQGSGWDSFLRLLKARNAFTHPKNEGDLYRSDVGEDAFNAVVWFFAIFVEMSKSIGDILGVDVNLVSFTYSQLPSHARAKLALIKPPPPDASSLSELLYEAKLMGLFAQDSRAAYDVFSKGVLLHNGNVLVGEFSDFGARLNARVFFTEIEAFYYMARRLLEQSMAKGEIDLAEEDVENLAVRELLLKIAGYAELFSEKFGYGRSVDTSGADWAAFSQFASFRDRITHPKESADLRVNQLEIMELTANTMGWHVQFLDALELSEKYVNLHR